LFANSLFVNFKFHFMDLFDMINWHRYFFLRLNLFNIFISLFISKKIIINWALLLAHLIFHIKQSIIIAILRVVAIFIFRVSILIYFIVNIFSRDGSFIRFIEGFWEFLSIPHWIILKNYIGNKFKECIIIKGLIKRN